MKTLLAYWPGFLPLILFDITLAILGHWDSVAGLTAGLGYIWWELERETKPDAQPDEEWDNFTGM